MKQIMISGFADEIAADFDTQLATVKKLGMQYISLRSANSKNIAEFTVEEVRAELLPKLREAGIGVSSLGSPIGKVGVEDEAAFVQQMEQLRTLCEICRVLDCKYIRVFSFYIPEEQPAEQYHETVVRKMKQFARVAQEYNVVLIHENEKDIYGDIGARCCALLKAVDSPALRAAFDFANFVQCGEDPCACWNLLRPWIVYIHIKDAVSSDKENVLCGTGEGCIPQLLRQAICQEQYEGFLTLEPHLVLFASLQSLEISAATDVIKANKYEDGAQGYAAQYNALCDILSQIEAK